MRARLGGNSWFRALPPPDTLGPEGWESEKGRRTHFPPREYEQKWVHHGWPLFGLVHYLRNMFVHGPQSVRDGVFPSFESIEDYIRENAGWLFVDLWCVDQKFGGKFSRQVAMGQGADVRRKMLAAAPGAASVTAKDAGTAGSASASSTSSPDGVDNASSSGQTNASASASAAGAGAGGAPERSISMATDTSYYSGPQPSGTSTQYPGQAVLSAIESERQKSWSTLRYDEQQERALQERQQRAAQGLDASIGRSPELKPAMQVLGSETHRLPPQPRLTGTELDGEYEGAQDLTSFELPGAAAAAAAAVPSTTGSAAASPGVTGRGMDAAAMGLGRLASSGGEEADVLEERARSMRAQENTGYFSGEDGDGWGPPRPGVHAGMYRALLTGEVSGLSSESEAVSGPGTPAASTPGAPGLEVLGEVGENAGPRAQL